MQHTKAGKPMRILLSDVSQSNNKLHMAKPLDQRITKPIGIVIAILCGIGMIATYHAFPGWEQVFLAPVVVMGFLLVQFREQWRVPRYWLLLLAVFIVHVCLMVWLRGLLNEFRFFSTLMVILGESFAFFVLFRRLLVSHNLR